jgi:hypothetical protein
MLTSTKAKLLFTLAGMIMGGLLVGAHFRLRLLGAQHHYREIATFFRGKVLDKEVVGIAYLDYHGLGIMERTQWKIELRDGHGQSLIIYQNRSLFTESVPHTPEIEINDAQIRIDDGENALTITVDR